MFDRKGFIAVDVDLQNENLKDKQKLELTAIEAGAQDLYWYDNALEIYTKPEDLEEVKRKLEESGIKVSSTSIDWVAKELILVSEKEKETAEKLLSALDESDEVQGVYSNLKI